MTQKAQVDLPSGLLKIWDRGVRAFHWMLVLSVAGTLITGFFVARPWFDLHLVLGTIVAILLLFRAIWGFTGSTYARFSSFIASPRSVAQHAAELLRGKGAHYLGHNPLGGAMILALLLLLLALTATGLLALGGVLKDGPLAPITSYDVGTLQAQLHLWGSYILLGLIVAHVFGVLIESWRSRDNLIKAMITGTKRPNAKAVTAPYAFPRPTLTTALTVGIMALTGSAIGYYSLQPALGVPTQPLLDLYVKECDACHSVHHPSLAPKTTWRKIMLGLEDHFGENASLSAARTKRIDTYLQVNAAEVWDSKVAHLLRDPADSGPKAAPLRLTTTTGWKSIHQHIPGDTFIGKPVYGRFNCSNCHADALIGQFKPRYISVPTRDIKSKEMKR